MKKKKEIKKRTRLIGLFIVILLLLITINLTFMSGKIIEDISGISSHSLTEQELMEFNDKIKNKEWIAEQYEICNVTCNVPEPRKGRESRQYFELLNLKENEIYVIIQIEPSEENLGNGPSTKETLKLLSQGIKILDDHGMTLTAKTPRKFLEQGPMGIITSSNSFDFIRWIGIKDPKSKLENSIKLALEENPSEEIDLVIKLYEDPSSYQLNEIKDISNTENILSEDEKIIIQKTKLRNLEEISQLNYVESISKVNGGIRGNLIRAG